MVVNAVRFILITSVHRSFHWTRRSSRVAKPSRAKRNRNRERECVCVCVCVCVWEDESLSGKCSYNCRKVNAQRLLLPVWPHDFAGVGGIQRGGCRIQRR
jgi:hypothetical protein